MLDDTRSLFQRAARVRQFVELGHLSRPAQWNADRIVRVTGRYERGDDELALYFGSTFFGNCDLDKITGMHSERLRETRTHQSGVVPGEFGDWIGHLL